ncbi:MAG: DUF1877 family protein [Gemmataceae bacterium]
MAGRGSFQAISPDDLTRLLALEGDERWDFVAGEVAARFVERMDKLWAPIHCALSDGTIDGTLGEPPLCNAVLGDHLVYESRWGSYVHLKHPTEVAEIATELATLTRDQFADKWEQVEPNPDSDALGLSFTRVEAEEFWPCVEGMRAFYERAAAEGLAVLFHWG